mmetsp:Transcript_78223/g.153068  ORF Transcript_78223/g.153068 Transcript_78223/m.153068 type:complete len:290 (+) Transcript_78223:769-1638(+)
MARRVGGDPVRPLVWPVQPFRFKVFHPAPHLEVDLLFRVVVRLHRVGRGGLLRQRARHEVVPLAPEDFPPKAQRDFRALAPRQELQTSEELEGLRLAEPHASPRPQHRVVEHFAHDPRRPRVLFLGLLRLFYLFRVLFRLGLFGHGEQVSMAGNPSGDLLLERFFWSERARWRGLLFLWFDGLSILVEFGLHRFWCRLGCGGSCGGGFRSSFSQFVGRHRTESERQLLELHVRVIWPLYNKLQDDLCQVVMERRATKRGFFLEKPLRVVELLLCLCHTFCHFKRRSVER